jgi:transposase
MEAQTVNALASVVSHDETVRCLLAIELSKKSWIIAVNSPLVDRIGRYSLEVCDWKGLLERIERIRMRVARELNRPVRQKAQPCGRWDLTAKARPSKGTTMP